MSDEWRAQKPQVADGPSGVRSWFSPPNQPATAHQLRTQVGHEWRDSRTRKQSLQGCNRQLMKVMRQYDRPLLERVDGRGTTLDIARVDSIRLWKSYGCRICGHGGSWPTHAIEHTLLSLPRLLRKKPAIILTIHICTVHTCRPVYLNACRHGTCDIWALVLKGTTCQRCTFCTSARVIVLAIYGASWPTSRLHLLHATLQSFSAHFLHHMAVAGSASSTSNQHVRD